MTVYGGTYKFDGSKVEHHIDVSYTLCTRRAYPNEVWTGTTVIRDIKTEGDRLIYTARPAPFSGDGEMSVITLVYEKVK
jgi:Lipocalin-like domain